MQIFKALNFKAEHAWLTIIFVVIVSGSIFFLSGHKYEISPSQSRSFYAYDDRFEQLPQGRSEVFSIDSSLSELRVRYVLRQGFSFPYAGIYFNLKDSNGMYLDCSRFDAIKIRIASSQLSDCKIYMTLFDPKVSKNDNPITERYLQKDIVLTPAPKTIILPYKQFTTPEWWFQKNNITLNDVSPVDFSKVTGLKIESGPTAKTGVTDTLTISGIYMASRPDKYVFPYVILLTISIAAYFISRFTRRPKKDPVIITYDKKEVRNYRDIDAQKISDYIAKHFSEPELSIGAMGESLGFTQKKIAKVMNSEYKMSFKQYLTSIRIHEAKRLLQETDRLVIDIALEVGFNSISHFNRVFKTSTQISPLEFRNKKTLIDTGNR